MMDVTKNYEALRNLYPEAQILEQGGQKVAFIPNLSLVRSGQLLQLEALLWPHARDGYDSRLFLGQKVPGKAKNWKAFNIFGKSWWACSWQGVKASLPWPEMLSNHLRAL